MDKENENKAIELLNQTITKIVDYANSDNRSLESKILMGELIANCNFIIALLGGDMVKIESKVKSQNLYELYDAYLKVRGNESK